MTERLLITDYELPGLNGLKQTRHVSDPFSMKKILPNEFLLRVEHRIVLGEEKGDGR
jgi:hypothetical protein